MKDYPIEALILATQEKRSFIQEYAFRGDAEVEALAGR